jgi:hypothetical protein
VDLAGYTRRDAQGSAIKPANPTSNRERELRASRPAVDSGHMWISRSLRRRRLILALLKLSGFRYIGSALW